MWLDTLLENIFSFIPRIMIIRLDEAGFKTSLRVFGTKTTQMLSGSWYFVWPILMEYETCKIKPQVKDIRIQSVWTKDGHDLAVGGALRYYVKDNMKAQLEVYDYDESLQTVVLQTVCSYVRDHTFNEIKEGNEAIVSEVLAAIKKESAGWGLQIQGFGVTDIGKTRNIRLLTNDTYSFGSEFE